MSDRPSQVTSTPPGENEPQGSGWHQPETPGGWRKPAAPQKSDWRAPAQTKTASGASSQAAWHKPKPEETSYTPAPTSEAAPEAAAESETISAPPGVLPFDREPAPPPVVEQVLPYDETAARAHPESAAPEAAKAPPQVHQDSAAPDDVKAAAGSAGEGSMSDLGQPGGAAAPAGKDEEEEEADTFSMGELIALASLVDEGPKPSGSTGPGVPATGPTAAAQQSDAAEYARKQLELLTGSRTGSAAPAASSPASPGAPAQGAASDAADYARRQLEILSGRQPSAGAQPAAAPAVEPEHAALAQKFLDTEDQVRALRSEYQSGQITRDELQADLRQLMVLDYNQVWWMMGVETDTWYKFENNQWIPAVPPALAQAPAPAQPAARRQAPPTATGTIDPGRAGSSLPYLPSQEAVDSGATIPSQPIRTQEDQGMPLPRQVPVRDPEATIPGTQGVYLPPVRSSEAPTLEGTQAVSEPTVRSQPVSEATVRSYPSQQDYQAPAEQEYYPTVPAPGPQQDVAAPPDYDLQRESPIYEEAVKKKRRSNAQLLLLVAVIGVVGFLLLGACGIIAGVLYYRNLAEPWKTAIDGLATYTPLFQTARIYAADGTVLAELTSQQGGARTQVDLSKVSPYMIHALVSTENKTFFDDPGWDPVAIGRAFIQNFTSGDIQSGASTITQQIARNLILQDTTPSAQRKLQEIVIAAEIAQHPGYDKNFLLHLYLNEVYFGNQSYGVEAASQFYFGHSAADLNLAESAMLAGLIQAPATYDPVVNREAAFDRMRTIISLMISVNCLQFQNAPYIGTPFCINPARQGTAAASDPNVLVVLDTQGNIVGGQILIQEAQLVTRNFTARSFQVRYPHFVNFIQAQIENSFGTSEMFRRGFEIHTTLDPRLQDTAQAALQQQVASLSGNGVTTGTVMVTDPRDGSIRAMVGSPNFSDTANDGQENYALTWQQPGSSIKPVEYIGAFEGGNVNGTLQYFTPATILWDVPTSYATNPPYVPVNFDRLFHGPVAVRYALGNSYNIPAIKTFDFIGAAKWQDVATRLGLRFLPEAQFGLPTAIGATEVRLYDMMLAYGTIADNGQRVPLYAITSITDAAGNDVALPARDQPTQPIQPQVAFLMQNILTDNNARAAEFGTSSGLYLPNYPGLVAAKTGTSNDNRDLWTMGFSHNVVVGVWLGRPDNNPTVGTTSAVAIPIWNAVMNAALAGTAPDQFSPPQGVAQAQICADTGAQYDPSVPCSSVATDWFITSQPPPPANQGFVRQIQVDTWTGLQANQFCPDSTVNQTFANISDPFAVPWLNSADGRATAQRLGLTVPVQAAPAGQCDASTPLPQVRIVAPNDGQTLTGMVQVTGVVSAQNFNRYQLEVSNDGTNFTMVSGPFSNQQTAGGLLGQWDTTGVPNGIYTLRLAVFANADTGGYIYRTVRVGVNNAPPTAIPQPTIFPTFSPIFTPLPFDTPLPFGNATPTATISAGG